jgi:hypothetical protein
LATSKKQIRKNFKKYIKKQAASLEEIQGLIVPYYAKKEKKKKFKVKLNNYWTNLHKN